LTHPKDFFLNKSYAKFAFRGPENILKKDFEGDRAKFKKSTHPNGSTILLLTKLMLNLLSAAPKTRKKLFSKRSRQIKKK